MSETVADDLPEMAPTSGDADPPPLGLGRPVGFIGLGAMGLPMVKALVRAGHAVLACDSDMARLSLAVDACGEGLHTTPLATELGDRCDLVFLMLPDSMAVAEVTGDLAPHLAAGSLIADLGSSDPAETRLLAGALSARWLRLIDAPALGDPADAAAAELGFLVGGAPEDNAALTPYLMAMGEIRRHTGPVGSAHAAVRELEA